MMNTKFKKTRAKKAQTKSNLKLKVKLPKSPTQKPDTSKRKGRKKVLKTRSDNKLTTLDNWLKALYKPPHKDDTDKGKEASEHSERTEASNSETNIKKINVTEEIPAIKESNNNAITKTSEICPNNLKQVHKIVQSNPEHPAVLVVRLQNVNLLQLKKTLNIVGNKEDIRQKAVPKKRGKVNGLVYKNRASEYIKLKNKEYKCKKCDYTHRNLTSVTTHFDKEHGQHIYKCQHCPFETKQQYYFNTHVRFHGKPDIKCPHCEKMIKYFSYKMHLKTHQRNEKTEYKCDICEYQSYNRANVKRHSMTVHGTPNEQVPFRCDMCEYITILKERLKQHRKTVHSKEGVWLKCPHCEYSTRSKSHLARHVNDLHGEKSVQCTKCPQLFSSKEHLRYHMKRKHTNINEKQFYYCEMCPKERQYRTTEKGNLARHILGHRTLDEIEVFACHKCPYLGKSKPSLKTHFINAHLPELHTFKCQICGYSTSTKSRYNLHVKYVHGKPREKIRRTRKTLNENSETSKKGAAENVDGWNMKLEETDDWAESGDDIDDVVTETVLADSGAMKQMKLADFWTAASNLQG